MSFVREERDTQELDVVYINLSILGFYVNEHPAFFLFTGKAVEGFSLRKLFLALGVFRKISLAKTTLEKLNRC